MTESGSSERMSGFSEWLDDFCCRASAENLPESTVRRFRASVRISGTALERSRDQPEFNLSAGAYVQRLITDTRIKRGREAVSRSAAALKAAETRFGVEACILAAIWGLETDFGRTMGDIPVLDALATLAAGGERPEFWECELISALRIVASGAAGSGQLKGSWAGAMGHTQFMPSSYLSDSVSLSNRDRADIWGDDPSDALASTANFLIRRGWQPGLPWGGQAVLPEDFDFTLSGHWNRAPAARWRKGGVRLSSGESFHGWGECSLILPAGCRGPGFLVSRNFSALMRYNPSISYALAAGLLAGELRGGPHVRMYWPETSPLSRSETRELQTLLARLGHDTGGIDGLAGPSTLRSVQKHQSATGEVPDGLPNRNLLERLRR